MTKTDGDKTNGGYSYRTDVYSLGVVAYELHMLWSTQMERGYALEALKAGAQLDQSFVESYPRLAQLVSCMVCGERERSTAYGVQSAIEMMMEAPDTVQDEENWMVLLEELQRTVPRAEPISDADVDNEPRKGQQNQANNT